MAVYGDYKARAYSYSEVGKKFETEAIADTQAHGQALLSAMLALQSKLDGSDSVATETLALADTYTPGHTDGGQLGLIPLWSSANHKKRKTFRIPHMSGAYASGDLDGKIKDDSAITTAITKFNDAHGTDYERIPGKGHYGKGA